MPTFPVSQRKQGNFKKPSYLCLIDYTKAFDCADHNTLWKALKEMDILPLEWRVPGAGATVRRYPMFKGREARKMEQWLHSAAAMLRRYPKSKGKGKPQQDGRKIDITFRIKPHTRQRCSEGSNIPCVHQDPETQQRLRQSYIWVSPEEVRVSNGLLQGQGLCVQQTWVWHKPSWRRSPLTAP